MTNKQEKPAHGKVGRDVLDGYAPAAHYPYSGQFDMEEDAQWQN